MRNLILPLLLGTLMPWCEAQDPRLNSFLRPNDVIALIGGEDMLAADESGYLEFLLQRALPQHHLKVRCLAWEGDTVFEQPRMLNYPSLEQQLNDIGATVVITQFGQTESFAGPAKLQDFIAAYARLLGRVTLTDQRRLAIIAPTPFDRTGTPWEAAVRNRAAYEKEIQKIPAALIDFAVDSKERRNPNDLASRDGLHLSLQGHEAMAATALRTLLPGSTASPKFDNPKLLDLIRAKNRLWNNYRRPQNWAFLAGDRTEQPSSRDHIDRNKRWFPEEMKQWLPLIEAKENEIWKLATDLAGK